MTSSDVVGGGEGDTLVTLHRNGEDITTRVARLEPPKRNNTPKIVTIQRKQKMAKHIKRVTSDTK